MNVADEEQVKDLQHHELVERRESLENPLAAVQMGLMGRGHGRQRRDPKDGAKSIEATVRDAIRRRLPDDPTILAIAEALSINTRTLQRRLAKDGWSYRRLLDDCRRRLAEDELSRQELSIADISRRLGYSDPSHFVRAFRRWTGETPSRFHARMKP